MNFQEFNTHIFSSIRHLAGEELLSVRIAYCHEELVGYYGVYYLNLQNIEKEVEGGEFFFTAEESNLLNDYLLTQRLNGINVNRLELTIDADLNYTIESSLDEKYQNINEGMKEAETEKKKRELRANPPAVDQTIDFGRFTSSDVTHANHRVLSFDPSVSKITAQLFVRAFALLGVDPEMTYEGFIFPIFDNQTQLHFCVGRSASGAGYFADDTDQNTIENLQEFHQILFSDSLELKECSATFEHDFGQTKMGFAEGRIFEISV